MSSNDTRQQVSETYTRAVESAGGSCCSPGCCTPQSKGAAAQTAGYDVAELAGLPADAIENSFGCGNPLAFSGVEEGQTVLDLGSGAGIDLIIAANKVGPTGKVIGVDMTDVMIERARANIELAGMGGVIEVRKGIIEELPVEESSVDWVISNCVVNLSPEKDRVFAEIARVLRPGGRISISDIVVEELPQWARESQALYGACVAGAISEHDYLEGLRRAGLVEVEAAERWVYSMEQLSGLLESELVAERAIPLEDIKRAAVELEGKVWSAKVIGRKP